MKIIMGIWRVLGSTRLQNLAASKWPIARGMKLASKFIGSLVVKSRLFKLAKGVLSVVGYMLHGWISMRPLMWCFDFILQLKEGGCQVMYPINTKAHEGLYDTCDEVGEVAGGGGAGYVFGGHAPVVSNTFSGRLSPKLSTSSCIIAAAAAAPFKDPILVQVKAHFGPLWWEPMGGSFLNACGQTASGEVREELRFSSFSLGLQVIRWIWCFQFQSVVGPCLLGDLSLMLTARLGKRSLFFSFLIRDLERRYLRGWVIITFWGSTKKNSSGLCHKAVLLPETMSADQSEYRGTAGHQQRPHCSRCQRGGFQ
eukprot:1138040-Pelagomonas_calceolata.AAC.3